MYIEKPLYDTNMRRTWKCSSLFLCHNLGIRR
nr:MAG TPA: hypothetical protein [Caudoviricetes sp.]DAW76138.1 MAG TPA: hypothetical protein [Bacteriophage sp.]